MKTAPAAPFRCLRWGCTAAYATAADLARHKVTCTGGAIQRPDDLADGYDERSADSAWAPLRFACSEPNCDATFTETLALFNHEQMHLRQRRKRQQDGTTRAPGRPPGTPQPPAPCAGTKG